MTEKQALLVAIFALGDAMIEFEQSEWYDADDSWFKEVKEAQTKLKEMFERRVSIS